MGHLTIDFAGICSHFLSSPQVPNLPVMHRVVLPYVATFRFGLVNVAMSQFGDPQPYYIQPHFPSLQYNDRTIAPPTIPGIMTNGSLYPGCTISVVNATNEYEPQFDLYHLADYLSDYAYS